MVGKLTEFSHVKYLGSSESLAHTPQTYAEASSSFLQADFLAWEIIRHVCM